MTKLQGGATGQWDIGAPTAEFVEAMVAGNFIEKLDWSSIPNAAFIDPQFQNFYDGDKADLNDYHLPKDWGTTGHRPPDEGRQGGRQHLEGLLRGRPEVLRAGSSS